MEMMNLIILFPYRIIIFTTASGIQDNHGMHLRDDTTKNICSCKYLFVARYSWS
jgi:hypothetical protein